MAWYAPLIKMVSGSGASIIDSIAGVVDEYVHTDAERIQVKMELQRIQIDQEKQSFEFQKQMESLTQKREAEIEATIRTSMETKSKFMMAELSQDDTYTKKARPTVIYAGLLFIFLEMFGLRYLILENIGFTNFNEILGSSKEIFNTFLISWGGVVGAYSLGRSAEKRGMKNKAVSLITGK